MVACRIGSDGTTCTCVRAVGKGHGIAVVELVDAAQVRPAGKTGGGGGGGRLDFTLHGRRGRADRELRSRVPLEPKTRVKPVTGQWNRRGKGDAAVKGPSH